MARKATPAARTERFQVGKAAALAVIGLALVPIAVLEAASQLPGGRASPVQLPVLTSPATVNVTAKDREQLLRGEMPAEQRERLVASGTRRLASEPLDPTAMWLWSLGQEQAKARQALLLADQFSRRERVVQLELVRLKAMDGKLGESLVHLDHALTVAPKAAPLVLKGIAAGLGEPQLIRLFKPYEQRPWYRDLLEQAVNFAPRPQDTAQLLLQGNLGKQDLPANFLSNIMSRLIQIGDLATAETIAKRFTGMGDKAMEQFAPTPQTMMADAKPLSWELFNDTNVMGERIANGVAFEVEPGLAGTLMARITGFAPGTYTLKQTVLPSSEDLLATWKLQCLGDKVFVQNWAQPLPPSATRQTYQTTVTIPSDCRIQRWELSASNQSGTERNAIEVTGLDLSR